MLGVIVSAMMVHAGVGAAPTDEEMFRARCWVAARFEGAPMAPSAPRDAIEVIANHGPVQPNARAGEPLAIGPDTFTRGLYCHAPSELRVHLSRPAVRFEAVAGIDSRAGGGTVVFVVRSRATVLWSSGLVRFGDEGLQVSVPLEGATEFVLQVSDGGDGIACDQANWAEARVILEDGSALWLGDLLLTGQELQVIPAKPFFSFACGGRDASELLPTWEVQRGSQKLDGTRTRHEVAWTDPATGLVVRCSGTEYHGFPTVEWTLYLRNDGSEDTPILSDILAIDESFGAPGEMPVTLHRIRGDRCTADSYEPLVEPLEGAADVQLGNTGGRPTQDTFPCFNLASPGGGLVLAVSWAGQWQCRLTRDATGGLRLRAGQEDTHFRLHPGEEVRSPMIVMQFYRGDWLRGQNLWRSWMVAHNLPRQDGAPLKPQTSLCTGNYYPGLMSNAADEIAFIRRYTDEGIRPDYWWQDAGWYPCDGVGWPRTGTWEVDPGRFPEGLREVGDFARQRGMGTLVWFEPERVHPGTWLAEHRPEWVHGGTAGGLLRLGDPACRAWLTDRVDRLITEQRIDFYRQDFNIDPLPYWRAADATESPEGDRQGIAEIRHVEGYFAFWDELRRRHPGMPIDSCASGGRRNDLETLRRAVPLLRSDWYAAPAGQQCHTYGLSLWLPFTGTGVISQKGRYWMRSSMVAEFTFGPDAAGLEPIDFAELRACQEDWRQLAPYFYGDFHPLTPYTLDEDQWMAWQYARSDGSAGVVQAFRRQDSPYEAARFALQGLDTGARYRITNADDGGAETVTGRELAEQGLRITLPEKPQAGIFLYQRLW